MVNEIPGGPPRVGPANADGLEETDITSADVPVDRLPRPCSTRSGHFVKVLSCKHQSHNFSASWDRSQPQRNTNVRAKGSSCVSSAGRECAEGWWRASGEFRIADGAPNAYSDT